LSPTSAAVLAQLSDRWRPRFLLIIADPDVDAEDELVAELVRNHVDVEVCTGAADALVAAGTLRPDAVLVAAEPGDLTSTEVVRVLCKRTEIPVVVGIGDGQGDQAGAALASGAAACVARPYRPGELIPIMKSIRPETIGTLDPPITRGALRLDPATHEVLLHGRSIRLPLREFELLRFFMIHADRLVTREQIYETVWGARGGNGSNTLSVHIKRLRHRLGDNRNRSAIILTVRGIGYRFIPPSPRRTNGPT
jgi:DNA-binding response OmpR family regulator